MTSTEVILSLHQSSLISKRPLHVISRPKSNIKPASPTPLTLKKYHLSHHDHSFATSYMPAIFFYPTNSQSLPNKTTISDLLKNSLSKTLSMYYPFAGRLSSSGSYIECNDQGVRFLETQIPCKLSDILEKAPVKDEEEGFGHLFPPGSIWGNVLDSCLLLIQLNHFSCGGVAIAVSLSHRIGDACTLFSFVRNWATVSRNSTDHTQESVRFRPCFMNELPPQSSDDDSLGATQVYSYPEKYWITREMVFHNSKIAQLKADHEKQNKLHGIMDDHHNYTRNELVTALLYRCALVANATSNSGAYPKSVLLQTINMRPLFAPPVPETSVGNFQTVSDIPASTEDETKLNSLLGRIRKGKMQLKGLKSLEEREFKMDKVAQLYQKVYVISSLCNFPLYDDDMDFGWGRPVRANMVDTPSADCIFLMDTPGKDGIKATVSLEEQDMKNFLADKELRAYASF